MVIPALLFHSILTAPTPIRTQCRTGGELAHERPVQSSGKAVSPDVVCRDAQEFLD